MLAKFLQQLIIVTTVTTVMWLTKLTDLASILIATATLVLLAIYRQLAALHAEAATLESGDESSSVMPAAHGEPDEPPHPLAVAMVGVVKAAAVVGLLVPIFAGAHYLTPYKLPYSANVTEGSAMMLVLRDVSPSMKPAPFPDLTADDTQAVVKIVSQRPGSILTVIDFDDESRVVLPATVLPGIGEQTLTIPNPAPVRIAPKVGTALCAQIVAGIRQLEQHQGPRVLVVISDFRNTSPSDFDEFGITAEARRKSVKLVLLAARTREFPALKWPQLVELGEATGGFLLDAADPQLAAELESGLAPLLPSSAEGSSAGRAPQ